MDLPFPRLFSAASSQTQTQPVLQHTPLAGILVALLCAAFLVGPAFNSYLHYDFTHSIDAESYYQMAHGNFDVTVTHKYRIVVPLLARAVKQAMEVIFPFIWPNRDVSAHHLRFGFFVVNLAFMSLAGWALFATCRAYQLSWWASCLAVMGLLASRWSNYLASLPLVDSFHVFCVAVTFLAIKTQNGRLLALGILLGPISKESFIFIAPATLLFGSLRVWVQLVLYAISSAMVLAIHQIIDLHFPPGQVGSVHNAFLHLHNVGFSLRRAGSPAGMGDIFTVLGLFNGVWLWALTQPKRWELVKALDWPLWFLLGSVIVQALISTSLSRMLFVAGPFWVVLLGKGFELISERYISVQYQAPAVERAKLAA